MGGREAVDAHDSKGHDPSYSVFAQSKHWSFWQSHRFGDWRSLMIPKAIPWLTPGSVLLSNTTRNSTAVGAVTGEFAWPRVIQFGNKVLF